MANQDQPHDEGAERAVLGGILIDPTQLTEVATMLRTEDFYLPRHATIYDAITAMFDRGDPIDPITVHDRLARIGEADRIGGALFLHELVSGTPVAAQAPYYAGIVSDLARRRRLGVFATRLSAYVHSGTGDSEGLISNAYDDLDAVAEGERGRRATTPIGDTIDSTIEYIERMATEGRHHGVPTGFHDLDRLTTGMHPGQLILIAARPSVGKSTLGINFATHVAIHEHKPVVFFSLEMDTNEINLRVLSSYARIPLERLRSGNLSDEEWQRIAARIETIRDAPLYIDASATTTVPEIKAKARRLHSRHELGLIVVDYLQLLSSARRTENRQQEVSEQSRGLKLLAKDLGVPVVAMSQLNRALESRSDKRPQLSDLRESGALEQDSDVVMLLYREDMIDENSPRVGELDLIVAKQRNGPQGVVALTAQLHLARFSDMAREDFGA